MSFADISFVCLPRPRTRGILACNMHINSAFAFDRELFKVLLHTTFILGSNIKYTFENFLSASFVFMIQTQLSTLRFAVTNNTQTESLENTICCN